MSDYAKAERLRELRADKRMSREKVAMALDVTTKTVYAWENGGAIKWENAKKLAAFYDVEPAEIVTRDPVDLSPAFAELRALERKVDRLLEHFGLDVGTVSEAVEAFEAETADETDGQGGQAPPRRDRRAA